MRRCCGRSTGFEFEQIPEGTRLTHAEHGVFFDEFWTDGPNREEGMRGLLEALGSHLGSAIGRQTLPAPGPA